MVGVAESDTVRDTDGGEDADAVSEMLCESEVEGVVVAVMDGLLVHDLLVVRVGVRPGVTVRVALTEVDAVMDGVLLMVGESLPVRDEEGEGVRVAEGVLLTGDFVADKDTEFVAESDDDDVNDTELVIDGDDVGVVDVVGVTDAVEDTDTVALSDDDDDVLAVSELVSDIDADSDAVVDAVVDEVAVPVLVGEPEDDCDGEVDSEAELDSDAVSDTEVVTEGVKLVVTEDVADSEGETD